MSNVEFRDQILSTEDDHQANNFQQPLKVYHLSHDLRGPLNSILGFTELLLEGIEGPINDIQAEDLAAIQQSAKNLLALISMVVDLSKVSNDQLILTFEPVSLEAVVNKVLDKVTLEADLPEPPPMLWGDPDKISQMVKNLVDFAHSVPHEGHLGLGITLENDEMILRFTATKVQLSVEKPETLFDLFVEVDEAGRSKLGPGGLTLPLTRQLAAKHHGQVWISHDELNTTFYLKLPVHHPDQDSI